MSTERLNPFSYTVLVLIGAGGAGPHDLVRMARQGRVYWDAADSQYYAEPKRLEQLGYLSSRKEPGRTRQRTHYMLTDKGREALAAWMEMPARFPRIQNEPVVRLMAADLVGEGPVVESLEGLRAQIAELSAGLESGEELVPTLPHREKYLRLNHRLARRLLEAHLDWLDEVESELKPRARGRSRA